MKKRLILSIVESKVNDIIRRQKYLDKLNSEVGFLGTITNKNLFKGSLFKKEANALIKEMDWDDDDTFETNHSEMRSNIVGWATKINFDLLFMRKIYS